MTTAWGQFPKSWVRHQLPQLAREKNYLKYHLNSQAQSVKCMMPLRRCHSQNDPRANDGVIMPWLGGWLKPCRAFCAYLKAYNAKALQWRHIERNAVSYHWRLDCFHNRLFRHWSKKISRLHLIGLWRENSSVTGDFPAQRASDAKDDSIWCVVHQHGGIRYKLISVPLWNILFWRFIGEYIWVGSIFQRWHF